MRVVHLSCFRDPLRRSGAELLEAWPTLADVAAAAAGAGAEVTVVQAAWRDEVLEHRGVRLHLVAEPGLSGPPPLARAAALVPRRLLAAAKSASPHVVHFQGLGFPVQTRMAASLGAPLLAQDHADKPLSGHRRVLQRWGLTRAAGVAFTSREQAQPFIDAGVLRPEMPVFEVVESSSHFTPDDLCEARRETGIGGDPCLLWIGRLQEGKDPMTVLDAVAMASERVPGLRLWMAYGEAPMEDAVRARVAADPRLSDRVRLLGRVPHARVQALCRAADFFVAASRAESSGYALLEALACGATPLVTDIPAFRRATRGGAVGGLFPLGDSAALAKLLIEHSNRPRGEMRAAAVAHFERHLSFAALGRDLRAAYDAVAAG